MSNKLDKEVNKVMTMQAVCEREPAKSQKQ